MTFQVVRCPACGSVVMEIATGLARGKCPNRTCGRRLMVASNGHEVRITMVDTPQKRLAG